MTNYIDINKPSGTDYTNQNTVGKEQYDQSSIEYDDTGVFYDGMDESLYTNVSKPSATTYTDIAKP